jgi:hypothetical protein
VRRILRIVMCLAAWLALAAPAHAAPGASPAPAARAIWIWEAESYAMLEHEPAAARAITFLTSKSIGIAYLYADAWRGRNLIAADPQSYRRLIRRMHAQGLQVHALLGSGELHTERYVLPRYRQEALAMLRRVLDYNRDAALEERFDGANLDIEPHILDAWSTRKMELLAGFIDLSNAFMELKRESGLVLRIGLAMPFWLDGIQLEWQGRSKPVSEHLQDLYDYVALMDYRDHAAGGDGLVSHAQDEIRYGERIGRKVWVGVETSPNELQKVSFHHLREPDMERELDATARALGPSPAFGGFVIHHYAAYRRWLGLD